MINEVIKYSTEAEWLALRKQDVTSTESAALFGLSPYLTKFDLWHRKKSGKTPKFKENDRIIAGRFLEPGIADLISNILTPVIADLISNKMKWEIRPFKDYIRIPSIKAGASFDFEVVNEESSALLEIKNVDYFAYKNGWKVEDDFIEAPAHIELQVQHQMMVSGHQNAYIGVLIGGNKVEVLTRKRNDKVIGVIKRKIEEFWESIEKNIEPAPIMPEDANSVILQNSFCQPGKVYNAEEDERINYLVERYKKATALRNSSDVEVKSIKAELLTLIGDAEKVILKDYVLKANSVANSEGTVITQEMVGNRINERNGYRNLRISDRKE